MTEYHSGTICSFRCDDTERLFHSESVPRFRNIERAARRKLLMLNAAPSIGAMRIPPGNRLELLAGDRQGQYSVRINEQWRLCFVWRSDGAHDVEIVDYHGMQVAPMRRQLDEIHPGEILLEEFMKPNGLTARQLSADIDVSPSRISEIVNGQRPITADTALRLGLFFGMEPRFWINLQSEYDMRVATRTLLPAIKSRIRRLVRQT